MQLTENFHLEEFLRSHTADKLGILNDGLSSGIIDNLRWTAKWLEIVRAHFQKPVLIASGWRSPDLNRAVGGSPTSAHLDGLAVDFWVLGVPTKDVFDWVLGSKLIWDQLEQKRTTLHVGLKYPRMQTKGLGSTIFVRRSRGDFWVYPEHEVP